MQRILVYGVDVSDPENPKYRAMQVDQHGRLVIDPEELDTRYLKLDGLYPMTGTLDMGINNAIKLQWTGGVEGGIIKAGSNSLDCRNWADTAFKRWRVGSEMIYEYLQFPSTSVEPIIYANRTLHFKALNTAVAWETCARMNSWLGAGLTNFDIPQAGDIIPVSSKTKSLGSVAKYWNQAFIDEVLLTSDIDLEPSALPRIYFDHDGVSAEDSIEYDKTNNRLLFYIGGSVVGYVDNTGFHDGAP